MKTQTIKTDDLNAAIANAPEGTRFIQTAAVMDDSQTGGFVGFYATPEQETAYNEGMARLAELG